MTRRLATLLLATLLPALPAHADEIAQAKAVKLPWLEAASQTYVQADHTETRHDVEGRRRVLHKIFDDFEAQPPSVRKLAGDAVVDLYVRLADLDRSTGRRQEAIVEYQRAIELAATTRMPATMHRAYDHMAELYFSQGDYDKAIEEANTELREGVQAPLYTNYAPAAILMLARCHLQQGLLQQASNEFNQVWILLETATDPEMDMVDVLQDESARLYTALGMDGPAVAARRAERVRTSAAALAPPQVRKSEAFLGTVLDHPSGPAAALPPAPPPPLPAPSSQAPSPDSATAPQTVPPTRPVFTLPNFVSEEALRECRPGYPLQAVRRGEQGAVHLRLFIDETGKMRSATIINSSGWPALDQASVEAFSRCRFKPGTRDGKATTLSFDTIYVWALQE